MSFLATYYFKSIEDIPYKLFEENDIQGILIDLDNTLTDVNVVIAKRRKNWIEKMQEKGIKICIVSNTTKEYKIQKMREELGVLALCNANKPMKKGFLIGEKLIGIKKENLVMIGDQIFTDIYGANRVKMKSILVRPFDGKEPFFIKMKRPIEELILKINKVKL